MNVFTAAQMREFDRAAIEDYGVPGIVLMENAALRVVEFLEAKFSPLREKRIVVLCGKGNNGGDGLAIARHLNSAGCVVTVVLAHDASQFQGDAKVNLLALQKGDDGFVRWIDVSQKQPEHSDHNWFDIAVDALLGTGFRGEVTDEGLKRAFSLAYQTDYTLAVDVPSGLESDTGRVPTKFCHIAAHDTVTFVGPKRGLFTREGVHLCGQIWVGEVGSSPLQKWPHTNGTGVDCLTREVASNDKPQRPVDAHKGTAGRALVCGGSLGMSGAPALASRAALRVGAGLVAAALPERVLPIFAAQISEPTSHALACDDAGFLLERAVDELAALWSSQQVVALGPGLGRTGEAFAFARRVVRECPVPLVVDADALHALPAIADEVQARQAGTILTPHPGEMGVLLGKSTEEVEADRFASVAECAAKYNAISVLKGARTLVAIPNGDTYVNLTGNAGMATGGSGDVLTGAIAGLLAQTRNAQTATLLGVYLHGLSGDLAFATRGNGLIAGDIAEHLPAALLELDKPGTPPINGRLRKLE